LRELPIPQLREYLKNEAVARRRRLSLARQSAIAKITGATLSPPIMAELKLKLHLD
jgi:hypothetical protein